MSVSQDPERVHRAAPVEHARERRVRAEECRVGEIHTVTTGAMVDEGDVGADGRAAEADAVVVDWVVGLELVAVWGLNVEMNERIFDEKRVEMPPGQSALGSEVRRTSVGCRHHTSMANAFSADLFIKRVFAGPCACSASIAALTPQKPFRRLNMISCPSKSERTSGEGSMITRSCDSPGQTGLHDLRTCLGVRTLQAG